MAEKKKEKKGGLLTEAQKKSELNKQRAEAIKKGNFKKVREIQKKMRELDR